MSESITDFIKDKVYPRLDAVDRGLLNHLHPKSLSANGSYVLDCPVCGKDRAFYYPNRSGIQCNRKENCPSPFTSLWDALAKNGMANGEVVKVLCEAAGVEPPDNRDPDSKQQSRQNSGGRPPLTTGQAIMHVTQQLAARNKHILDTFQQARGYTDEDMASLRLGVFTTNDEVLSLLHSLGISKEQARDKGIVSFDDATPESIWSGMEGRVIGYWPHPDGDARIWGRIPSGPGVPRVNPKYRFSPNSSKDIPYLFRKRQNSILVAVEGTLDAWALQLMKLWGCAIGQASINSAQAAFLFSQGVTEAAHMVDGDHAGYEGALSSIREAEAVGITLSIIALGRGMDDADKMRTVGRGDDLLKLVQNRMNAGEYMARYCASLLNQSVPDLRRVAKIKTIAKGLGPTSRRKWLDWTASLGIAVDEESEAVRILSNLVLGGLSFEEAAGVVQRRTGYLITLTKDATHG
ncbi:hypothetical protein H8F21_14465 [Pseudomonas sp. P66]|uniref:DNA primase n=1 Tax=Pseudomonas arcuscaelestis TaxID=2710591 RepID=A0ABS2C0C3_9PSED|nr:hypothetical protein [Pseudomonas arcuscaelestis]MBM5458768.1 hypothetical protein [Pseudomonas arcuscaelestis]